MHAQSAAAIFAIIASCRLHQLAPLNYLTEILRVLPYWPSERCIELSPLRWSGTRSKLNLDELEKAAGAITVPD